MSFRVDPVVGGMAADKADGMSQIEASHLHPVGLHAVVHDKCLITVPGEPLSDGHSLHPVAAEHERSARTHEHRTLYFRAFRRRKVVHMGTERRRILTGTLTVRIVRDFRQITLRPQIDGRRQRVLVVIPGRGSKEGPVF